MILDIGRGLLCMLFGLVAMVIGPFCVIFAGPVERVDRIAGQDIARSSLPNWLWWFQTPDERLPGGLYEPAILRWLALYGWHVCAALWLARNAGYGFAWWMGKPASGYLDSVEGQVVTREGLWRWKRSFGPIALQAGWKCHRADFKATAQDGPFRAIPFVSIRLKVNS